MTCACGEEAAYEDRGKLYCFECGAPYTDAPRKCPICMATGWRDWCSNRRRHRAIVARVLEKSRAT